MKMLNMKHEVRGTIWVLVVMLFVLFQVGCKQEVEEAPSKTITMNDYYNEIKSTVDLSSNPQMMVAAGIHDLVNVMFLQGKIKKAIEHLEDMLEDTTDQKLRNDLHLELTDAYQKAGDLEGAEKHVKAILKENSGK